MAVKGLSTITALKKLEDQLTCAICLDLYTNPKSLPCLHSFCQQCLEGLPLDPQGDNYFISCPTCRYRTQLPKSKGAADFPTAFQINNFKEVHNLLMKVSGQQQVTCKNCTTTNAIGYCKECGEFLCQECIDGHKKYAPIACHNITSLDEVATSASQLLPVKQEIKCSTHNEPLKIFCGTCEKLACYDCTVRIPRGHDYDLITDCYPKHCQKLQTSLKPVSEKIAAIIDVLRALTDREIEIKEQDKIIKEEIHVMVEEKIDLLRQSERQLVREVDTITASKLQVLSEQKKSAETSLSQLKDCKEVVEQSLEIGSPQQVVTSTKQMTGHITHVTQQVEVEEFIPREKANLCFDKSTNIDDVLYHIGKISTSTKSTQSLPVANTTASASVATADQVPQGKCFTGLSPDVLLLMPHLAEGRFKGMVFYPEEGRVEVLPSSEEEQEKCISKFQTTYQSIIKNHQLKSGNLEVPPSFPTENLLELIEEFNNKFNQCNFSFNEQTQLIRIVSISSRQFNNANIMLSDKLKETSFEANKSKPVKLPTKMFFLGAIGGNNKESCPICLNEVMALPIETRCRKQKFCQSCLDEALKHSCYCPMCKVALKPVRGNQPPGQMTHTVINQSIPGYEGHGCIVITYHIPSGTQGPEHPNPGQRYHGTSRTAYLPDCPEGREVLQLLKKAFDAGLIFTVGTSRTTHTPNSVVWNDIHHKTVIRGQPYGYPDPNYLKRVKEELRAKGIQ